MTINSNDKGFIGDLNKEYASMEKAYLPPVWLVSQV